MKYWTMDIVGEKESMPRYCKSLLLSVTKINMPTLSALGMIIRLLEYYFVLISKVYIKLQHIYWSSLVAKISLSVVVCTENLAVFDPKF